MKLFLDTNVLLDILMESRANHFDSATIRFILSIATIASISENDIKAALRSDINDFEDAAQLSCAVDSECDFLISSDRKWKGYTPLPVYTPKEFCDLVFED